MVYRTRMVRLTAYFLFIIIVFTRPSFAEYYEISTSENLGFSYFVASIPFQGEFKIVESKFDIDFRQPKNSVFFVKFDLTQSNAGFFLATTAMKQVLDADRFPYVTFQSYQVEFKDKGFFVIGYLKVRDVSKPVNLFVDVLNDYNSASEEIRFSIKAKFNRLQFGADGYYPIVGDQIAIKDAVTLNKSKKK